MVEAMDRQPSHRRTGIHTWRIVLAAAAVAALCLVSAVGLYLVYPDATTHDPPHPAAWRSGAAAAPGLQSLPRADIDALLERRRRELDRYGWVDREAGIARIPIEEAMRLLPERHPRVEVPGEVAGGGKAP